MRFWLFRKICLPSKIWLATKLKRDYIKITKKQLDYLRNMDIFIYEVNRIYGFRVIIK
jgi:hypothetical protein